MPTDLESHSDNYSIERIGDVDVLRLAFPKANSMSPQMLTEFRAVLDRCALSDARALVITGTGRAFCAGLALPVIVDYDRDRLRAFMIDFAATMEAVFSFPKATVAAINGHAIAGGAVLALMCDRRVMGESSGRIGLNEVTLGIGLPASVIEPLRVRVPAHSLAPIALAGTLFDPQQARALDLVDELVPLISLDHVALRAAQTMAGPAVAVAQVKAALNQPVLERLRQTEAVELEAWLDTWFSPAGRERVGEAVSQLAR